VQSIGGFNLMILKSWTNSNSGGLNWFEIIFGSFKSSDDYKIVEIGQDQWSSPIIKVNFKLCHLLCQAKGPEKIWSKVYQERPHFAAILFSSWGSRRVGSLGWWRKEDRNMRRNPTNLSKAFDKVNHDALFLKLMKRLIPIQLLNLLVSWLSGCYSYMYVKWYHAWSQMFNVDFGVRQGSVLSPLSICHLCGWLSKTMSSVVCISFYTRTIFCW